MRSAPCLEDSGRRASSKGFLAVSLTRYLELLDGRAPIAKTKWATIHWALGTDSEPIGLDLLAGVTWCVNLSRSVSSRARQGPRPRASLRGASAADRAGCVPEENPLGLFFGLKRPSLSLHDPKSGSGPRSRCAANEACFPRTVAGPTERSKESTAGNRRDGGAEFSDAPKANRKQKFGVALVMSP